MCGGKDDDQHGVYLLTLCILCPFIVSAIDMEQEDQSVMLLGESSARKRLDESN